MLSTGSVVMKPSFGVKPGRFYMRSMFWIGANHRRESGAASDAWRTEEISSEGEAAKWDAD